MIENKTLKYVLVFFFAFALMMLNQTLIYDLIIPDVCYYHTNNMNSFMNLFYSAGGASNGHPEPNLFNFIISLLIGGFIGYKVYNYFKKIV